MARMNWDRASREYRSARANDYTAREDDLDRHLFDPDRPARVKRLASKRKTKTEGTAKSTTPVRAGVGKRPKRHLRENLRRDAAGLGISKTRLVEVRREALRAGWSLDAVLDGRAVEKGGVIRPKSERATTESPRLSGAVIKSRGALPPTKHREPGPGRVARSTKPLTKRQRAERTAQERRMTVDQLLEERHARAQENERLAAEARALGIPTRELRQRLAESGE